MAPNKDKAELYDNFAHELRRGALVLAVLSQLHDEQYGYSLKQRLEDRGMSINEGTLYPLLRRLEKQGLLESNWRVVDDKRPRRYYKISSTGATILSNLSSDWQEMVGTMDHLLNGSKGD